VAASWQLSLASSSFRLPVLALSVKAGLWGNEPLDWSAADDVRLDNLVYVGSSDVAVPDRIRVNHQVRAMFALVEASRLVRADTAL